MVPNMHVTRLRQAVVTAADRDAFRDAFTEAFGVGQPYVDPGVDAFGLHNYVFPVGDTFVEVVSPTSEGTTAGRFMERNGGDCGYMAIFQVEDIEACRDHLRELGVRMIWSHDSDEISAVHIHPQDIGGAIVSFDQPRPAPTWLWAGPGWSERSRTGVVTGLAGLTLSGPDAQGLAETWGRVLNTVVTADATGQTLIGLPDGCQLQFRNDPGRTAPALTGIALRSASSLSPVATSATIARTEFTVVP